MTSAEWMAFALGVVTILGSVMGAIVFVAKMASQYTAQTTAANLRLSTLELEKAATEVRHDRLDTAIDELTRAVYDLRREIAVNKERARSQHDINDSGPPEGHRR